MAAGTHNLILLSIIVSSCILYVQPYHEYSSVVLPIQDFQITSTVIFKPVSNVKLYATSIPIFFDISLQVDQVIKKAHTDISRNLQGYTPLHHLLTSLQTYSKEHNFTIAEIIDTNKTQNQMQNDSESKDNTSQTNSFKILHPSVESFTSSTSANLPSTTVNNDILETKEQQMLRKFDFYYTDKNGKFNEMIYGGLAKRKNLPSNLLLL